MKKESILIYMDTNIYR